MAGSLNVNRRFNCPLFQMQPIGFPFIPQRKSGQCNRCASSRACIKLVCHGICSHLSSSAVGTTDAMFASTTFASTPLVSPFFDSTFDSTFVMPCAAPIESTAAKHSGIKFDTRDDCLRVCHMMIVLPSPLDEVIIDSYSATARCENMQPQD